LAVLDKQPLDSTALEASLRDFVESDEAAARQTLRQQIGKLERELAAVVYDAFPRTGVARTASAAGGPRLLGLGELERIRDELAEKLTQARLALDEHLAAEEEQRQLLERMRLDPKRYKFVRVRCRDVGEGGCGEWQVRPRLGPIGMLMGWWEVKLSSGCPLAKGLRPLP
jgi:hypothetical protein